MGRWRIRPRGVRSSGGDVRRPEATLAECVRPRSVSPTILARTVLRQIAGAVQYVRPTLVARRFTVTTVGRCAVVDRPQGYRPDPRWGRCYDRQGRLMNAIELIGDVDEKHRLQVQMP